MASTWDSADLLARCKRQSGVPTTTEFPADTDWYAWLTEAQAYYYGVWSTHCPYYLMTAPTLLTSADSGVTYVMPSSTHVLAVELYDKKDGRLLKCGAYWDTNADYIWEGNKIRFPGGKAKTFSGGPYLRYVAEPGDVAAATEPTLNPEYARVLLVDHAVALWAERGGMRDPAPFWMRERKRAWGDPATPGDFGIIGNLKLQNPFIGASAIGNQSTLSGLDTLNTGSGYVGI